MLSSLVDHVSSPQPPLLHPLVPASSTISASAIAGLTLFLVFAVAFLLSALYSYLLPKPITGIPYNPEAVRCLLGDAPAMMRDERGPMDWLLDQGRRHSGPICQLFLRPFSKPFVLISDFREAQDIMLRRKEWDRSDYSIELLGGQAPYHHINQKTGPVWKAHRRLLQDLMMPAFLHRVAAPNIYASTLDLVKLWTDKERLAHGRPFSAENDIFYASLDSVLEFSFGSAFPHRAIPPQMDLVESHLRLHQQRPTPTTPHLPTTCQGAVEFASAPVHDTIEATLHASIAMGDLMDSPFPRLSWWFKSKMPYQAWAIRTRNRYLKEQVTRAVQRMSDNETDLKNETWVRSAVDLMMLRERMFANKEGRRPIYWSPSIRDEVIGFIVAGHDTTSTTVLWGLKFLSDSQTSQNKLRDALQTAHRSALDERRMPSAEEITRINIPYLEAVIEEILRLANTLPVLDRQTSKDTELLGYHIPKGTILMMLNRGPSFTEPGFAVDEKMRSPTCRASGREKGVRHWAREGMDAFYPERWLVYEEKDGPANDGTKRETATYDSTAGPSLPFGLGTRGCFGRKLAYLELRIMITLLVWQFRLGMCPEALSGYGAVETLTHKPRDCYVRLERIEREEDSKSWE